MRIQTSMCCPVYKPVPKMMFLINVLESLGVSGDASSFFDVSRIKGLPFEEDLQAIRD